MGLNASKVERTGSAPAEPLEAGNYIGRLSQVIDLGVQVQRPYKGQEKAPVHEIMLTYELGTEFLKDEDGNDMEDKPRLVSESIPLHHISATKAKSTKRAAVLDPKGARNGDFPAMISSPCTVTVVQNPKEGTDIVYVNISNITPPMKGFPVPELVNPPKVFDLDAPDMEIFLSLPEWIQTKIKGNLNFAGSPLDAALSGEAPKKEPAPAPEAPAAEEAGDDSDPWD